MPRLLPTTLTAHPMALFALASLAPLPLLLAGVWFGGIFLLIALLYVTLFTALIDQFFPLIAPEAPEGAEFPTADRLSVALAIAHFLALPLAVWAIAGDSGLSTLERALAFMGFGVFFGQVSNPNAHELIHRGDKRLFWLGMWVYITLLYGHHTSAHRHIHHRHVGTPDDPNTAAYGENWYAFAVRAWVGGFRAGYLAETALRQKAGRRGLHPYAVYIGGAAACALAMLVLFGFGGLVAYLGLAAYAQAQLLLSDYVQHYGLTRARLSSNRFEPVAPCHSWNAPHWFSAALMLNAPRHSDHHAHPARPYPALRLPPPQMRRLVYPTPCR